MDVEHDELAIGEMHEIAADTLARELDVLELDALGDQDELGEALGNNREVVHVEPRDRRGGSSR